MTAVAPVRVCSTAEIRAHFPALARRQGDDMVAYFDGPGGTQVPTEVVEAMSDYLYHHNANTHWAFPTSVETDEAIAASRRTLADFLGAAPDEIAFGQNMTSLTFHLARAIGRSLGTKDELVVTELDHHADIAPWRAVARERGLTVRTVRLLPERGELDWDDLERQLSSRTRLLAIGAASNAIGTITDVAQAAAMARSVAPEAIIFVDAVHYAPHQLVDVRKLDCDLLACSSYKFYGPHIGVLYGRRERLEALDVPKLDPAPNTAPERMETGTQSHESMVGAAAAVDFLASLANSGDRRTRLVAGYAALHERGEHLLRRLWEGLAGVSGVRLYGRPPGQPRTPTVGFTVDGVDTTTVARRLADRGVFVSNGDFYATTVVERLGLAPDGLVRAGCACYTTDEEVDRLVDGVRGIAAGLS
ncbi:MAG TPA: cysteine desulfurase-like protein [Gemmatimonadaceae bacterium]|nr:cysteine desulfurase-like protein [Gemmatimonadaceae bacterium]